MYQTRLVGNRSAIGLVMLRSVVFGVMSLVGWGVLAAEPLQTPHGNAALSVSK